MTEPRPKVWLIERGRVWVIVGLAVTVLASMLAFSLWRNEISYGHLHPRSTLTDELQGLGFTLLMLGAGVSAALLGLLLAKADS